MPCAVSMILVGLLVAGAAPRSDVGRPGDRSATRVAEAAAPLIVSGDVQGEPGARLAVPFQFTPGVPSSGRYIIVYGAPGWLSFIGAQEVRRGAWLLKGEDLEKVRMVIGAEAEGQQEVSVALTGQDGKIAWEAKVKVVAGTSKSRAAVATPASAVAPTAAAAPVRSLTVTPEPRPSKPLVVADAKQKQATPDGTGASGDAAPFSWEMLVQGKAAGGAAQKPAAKAAPPAGKSTAAAGKTDPELLEMARHLVRECTTCHNVYGQDVGIPLMIGLSVDRFLDTMSLYKRKKRDHLPMQVVAASLSDEETRALAIYLGRIKPVDLAEEAQAQATVSGTTAVPAAVTRQTDPKAAERVARWVQRGQEMLGGGDIAQARLLLQRAAEFGNSQAALLLASSFDPNVLPWRPGMGMVAEPLKARSWYERAKALGAGVEADRRLAELPPPR